MTKCIVCGSESELCICESCKNTVDIEVLVRNIIDYKIGSGENALWESIANDLIYQSDFKNIIFAITDDLSTPRKEYLRLLCISKNGANVPKASRPWLYEIYKSLNESDELKNEEHNRLKGFMLGALYMDYKYTEADALAGQLLEQELLPKQTYYNLVDFLSKTRRYDEANDVIENCRKLYGEESGALYEIDKLSSQNNKYRDAEKNGKKEYMPNPNENRDEAKKAYIDFITSIGIDIENTTSSNVRKSRYPDPIPKDQYPTLKETREANFDSFVAYDLKTTGFNTSIDSIIEIGAVKVVDGKIVDEADFVYQEFVKPFKRSIKPEITKLTGITKDDVKSARDMWEVFPDFMNFVGDNTLVGFNNIKFDGKFLERAGRYSNLVINNINFDVKRYAEQYMDKLNIDKKGLSLETISATLNIDNPKAHRALYDAITTAKVYLALKNMFHNDMDSNLDDLLDDIDNW